MLDPLAECISIFELDVGWIRPACVAADDPPSELAEFFASQNFGLSSEHEHMEQSTRVLSYYGIVHKRVGEKDECVAGSIIGCNIYTTITYTKIVIRKTILWYLRGHTSLTANIVLTITHLYQALFIDTI